MSHDGRLHARPGPVTGAVPTGLQTIAGSGESFLYVPSGYRAEEPLPLVVILHGSGGRARQGITLLRRVADTLGFALLSPASSAYTWDVIVGGFGPDVAALDGALEHSFGRYALDPGRLAIAGFSDGASYALSLGVTNGDLFTHVLAFSPGFMAPATQRGAPGIFVTHGTGDAVLPIDRCSRRIVPQLRRAGYHVEYREFDGGHTIAPDLAIEALGWFTGHID